MAIFPYLSCINLIKPLILLILWHNYIICQISGSNTLRTKYHHIAQYHQCNIKGTITSVPILKVLHMNNNISAIYKKAYNIIAYNKVLVLQRTIQYCTITSVQTKKKKKKKKKEPNCTITSVLLLIL